MHREGSLMGSDRLQTFREWEQRYAASLLAAMPGLELPDDSGVGDHAAPLRALHVFELADRWQLDHHGISALAENGELPLSPRRRQSGAWPEPEFRLYACLDDVHALEQRTPRYAEAATRWGQLLNTRQRMVECCREAKALFAQLPGAGARAGAGAGYSGALRLSVRDGYCPIAKHPAGAVKEAVATLGAHSDVAAHGDIPPRGGTRNRKKTASGSLPPRAGTHHNSTDAHENSTEKSPANAPALVKLQEKALARWKTQILPVLLAVIVKCMIDGPAPRKRPALCHLWKKCGGALTPSGALPKGVYEALRNALPEGYIDGSDGPSKQG